MYHIIAQRSGNMTALPDKSCSAAVGLWRLEVAAIASTALPVVLPLLICLFIIGGLVALDVFHPPFRLTHRYLHKFLKRKNYRDLECHKTVSEVKSPKASPLHPRPPRPHQSLSILEKMILHTDIFYLLASHSHHSDLASLKLVSPVIYTAVSDPQILSLISRRLCTPGSSPYTFRRYTPPTCWACDAKICRDCSYRQSIPQPATQRHLLSCRPTCIPCFYKRGAQRPRNTSIRKPNFGCCCRDNRFCTVSYDARNSNFVAKNKGFITGGFAATRILGSATNPLVRGRGSQGWDEKLHAPISFQCDQYNAIQRREVTLCSRCHNTNMDRGLSQVEAEILIARLRDERERRMLLTDWGRMNSAGDGCVKCRYCEKEMAIRGRGAWFWGCGVCNKECISDWHPQWKDKEKKGKGGDKGGEEGPSKTEGADEKTKVDES